MSFILARRILLIQLLLVVLQNFSGNGTYNVVVDAALSCSEDSFCEQMVRPGSYCIIEQDGEDGTSKVPQGVCSNPFAQGCLKTLLPEKLKASDENVDDLRTRIENFHTILEGRICNSDDDVEQDDTTGLKSDTRQCKTPLFKYPEIRIHNSNWESPIFLSWIYQIMLMEILEVPVAVGMGPSGVGHGSGISDNTYDASFYNPYNTFPYSSSAYPWDGLRVASKIGDCNRVHERIFEIIDSEESTPTTPPCVHVLPEVWNGQTKEWNEALREGFIDPVEGNGQVGKFDWYIPRYTASEYDNTLISFYGVRGEENRHKVAEAFKRPVQWKYYCENISLTNCTEPDTVATHYPLSESEQTSYFAGSQYTGYFHLSDKNDCTKNPTTCTGAIIGPPCTWSTNIDSQLYWNNIVGLEPDGPLEPHGGYSYSAMTQIWRAANATKSNVLMWWWRPDALIEEFFNTSYEFQPFVLPVPSEICANARVNTAARCSTNIDVRRGLQEGACDQEAHALNKVYASSLQELTLQETNFAYRSPGYATINDLKITDLQMNDILRRWSSGENTNDKYGYDPRDAVCSWVVDNLYQLLEAIPAGYPRKVDPEQKYHAGYRYTAITVAIFTNLIVWMTLAATHYYRKTRVMVFSQVYFIKLILFGFILISISAIVVELQPTRLSCTFAKWLEALGYTFELVPLLVKISAINKIMQSAKKLKRVQVSQKQLTQIVIGVVLVVLAYLIVWMIVDPLSAVETHTLETRKDLGESSEFSNGTTGFVLSNIKCDCRHYAMWSLIIVGGQGVLLLMASVLAFQSRNVQQEFNESRSLGTMVYSHFMFLLLRIVVTIFDESYNNSHSSDGGKLFPATVTATIFSLLYSFDTLAAVCIYVIPKVREAALPSASRPEFGSFYSNCSVPSSISNGGVASNRASYRPSQCLLEIEENAAKEHALFMINSRRHIANDIDDGDNDNIDEDDDDDYIVSTKKTLNSSNIDPSEKSLSDDQINKTEKEEVNSSDEDQNISDRKGLRAVKAASTSLLEVKDKRLSCEN